MTGLQITLLILGGVIFIISFFLPPGKKKSNKEDDVMVMTEDQIKLMVEKEIDAAKSHINDIVDETITYAMEKGERAMERITNEKMMAINEYSDTVLKEIHKNQQEVVFLYDMLNTKHTTLLDTVSQVNILENEMKQKTIDAGMDVIRLPDNATVNNFTMVNTNEETLAFSPFVPPQVPIDHSRILADNSTGEQFAFDGEAFAAGNAHENSAMVIGDVRNNNEMILEMHKEGKSNMSIARTLGLGIGEVKLVIDLFEGA